MVPAPVNFASTVEIPQISTSRRGDSAPWVILFGVTVDFHMWYQPSSIAGGMLGPWLQDRGSMVRMF